MAVVFVVFALAMLLVFIKPEGRARRIARLTALVERAGKTAGKVVFHGSKAVERAAAHLARDQGGRIGIDQLLHRPGQGPADPLDAKSES